jgi:hypothetical protein
MPTYFHVTPTLLGPGSILLPGNWGRILQTYIQANDILFREDALERIRVASYPAKPSRLNCIFLLESLEEAIWYKNNVVRMNYPIYEVTGAEGVPRHRGNYTKVAPVGQPLLANMPAYADAYWSTAPTERIEVVFAGEVTVVAQRQ